MHALLLLVIATATSRSLAQEQPQHHQQQHRQDDAYDTADPKAFFDSCRAANRSSSCTSYKCLSRHHSLDLRQLDHLPCKKRKDCLHDETGMVCVKYSEGRSFCECAKHHAYNATACACQTALVCDRSAGGNATGGSPSRCHNGMQCADDRCACVDLTRTLFEPQGRFCVLPRGPDGPGGDEGDEARGSHERAFWIVLCVIGAFASLAVLAIVVYVCTENVTCARGRYECEDEKDGVDGEGGQDNHIAAWDMPSLDYLSEEQTMKYLREHERSNDSSRQGGRGDAASGSSSGGSRSTASPTPSPEQSGSPPESERLHSSRQDHVNEGYEYHEAEVEGARDLQSRTSECHDL